MKKAKKITALLVLITMLVSVVQVISLANENNTNTLKEYTNETAELVLSGDFSASGCDAAIYAHNNAILTINGTGNVHGMLCAGQSCGKSNCGYATAVWANENSTIEINGGNYTNDADTVSNDKNHVDLIYAGNNSHITITGGTFKCSTPKWTLNCKDNTNSTITVKGGKYYQFDPSNTDVAPEGTTEIIVPEGYKVVQSGEWYEVKKVYLNKEYTNETAELVLSGDFSASGCDAAIYAHNNATLTINGTGNVHGMLCAGQSCGKSNCGYATAVWANENSTIEINGGNYTNDADTVSNDKSHVDLIYAGNNSHITITGGTFKCSTPKWTLNCKDNTNSTITVKGGKYYQFDPSNTDVAPEGTTEIIVPEEYKVVQSGEWYEVVCAHTNYQSYVAKDPTYLEDGSKEHWVCNVCSKWFADIDRTIEITDKNSLVIPKLVEVVNDNANVSEEAVDSAISDASIINCSTVEVRLNALGETVKTVTLPVSSLADVADLNKELAIRTSEVNSIIDTKALNKIVEQTGNNQNVTIEIIKVEKTVLNEKQKEAIKNKEVSTIISAKILANGKTISDFGGGKVILEIPFIPANKAKATDYKLVYIADDGNITDVPTQYVDGIMKAELEHFSEYAIVKVATTQNNTNQNNTNQNNSGTTTPATNNSNAASAPVAASTNNPKTGDGIVVYFITLVVAILGICAVVIIKAKRK